MIAVRELEGQQLFQALVTGNGGMTKHVGNMRLVDGRPLIDGFMKLHKISQITSERKRRQYLNKQKDTCCRKLARSIYVLAERVKKKGCRGEAPLECFEFAK